MVEIIGSDEALKGDTFGGMVVAAVKCNDKQREELMSLGVRDSKKVSPNMIRILANRIKEIAEVSFVNMWPEEYNENIEKYGLTGVMNKLHTKCINDLKKGTEQVKVDLFPGCKVEGDCITKAESKYTEVAAASIVARAEAVKQIRELSSYAGFKLPLGSTHVIDALIKMRDEKKDFTKFAKTSFRNVREIMNQSLKNF